MIDLIRNFLKLKNKKGIEMEMLVYFIIAVIVLIIGVAAYVILKGKGTGLLDQIKNMFTFGAK